jgi:hypothetical protein
MLQIVRSDTVEIAIQTEHHEFGRRLIDEQRLPVVQLRYGKSGNDL